MPSPSDRTEPAPRPRCPAGRRVAGGRGGEAGGRGAEGRSEALGRAAWPALALAALALGGGLAVWWTRSRGPRFARPAHVIVVTLDTFRADHVGCYGNPVVETPALDALALESVRFEDVSTSAPTTLASHVSLFTGTWPSFTGVVRNGFVVHPDNALLPELLRAAGFRTAGFAGSFALTEAVNFPQGFDHWDEVFEEKIRSADPEPFQRRAEAVTDAALAWLDRAPGATSPTFLFAHYFDAHHPYDPPPPFDTMYAPHDPELSGDVADQRRATAAHHEAILGYDARYDDVIVKGLLPELVLEPDGEPRGIDLALAARYAGEVSYLDLHLGRLFDGLRARGLWDSALVVVTADHGETFWEHGDFWDHGLGLYQTTVRLPLFVKLPGGARGGSVVREHVAQVDVLPTVLELCDLAQPGAVVGQSLVGALAGEAPAPRRAFAEATKPSQTVERKGLSWLGRCKAKAVRDGRYKLIATPYLGIEELYDLAADPGERHNLLLSPEGAPPGTLERLRADLGAWADSARPLPSVWHMQRDEGGGNLPVDTIVEGLAQLGYTEGPPGAAEAECE